MTKMPDHTKCFPLAFLACPSTTFRCSPVSFVSSICFRPFSSTFLSHIPVHFKYGKRLKLKQNTSSAKIFDSSPSASHHALDVEIYDTTLRDGAQGEGISLSAEDKLRIAVKLDEFGIKYIEGGWPGSNPKDVEFFDRINGTDYKLKHGALVVAFGSTRYKGKTCDEDTNVQALLRANTPVVTIVAKAWDTQVRIVLETTLEENLAMIKDTVQYLKERGKIVMVDFEHFYDGFKQNQDYAFQTLKAAHLADVLVLCDTNGGSLPNEITHITKQVHDAFPTQKIGIHCHNDMELAVSNSISAVNGGASLIQGTINGFGERTGNANLTSIIPILQLKMAKACLTSQGNLAHLTSLSRFVDEIANQPSNKARPFVGNSAFAHKGGLHVSAVLKDENTYQHIDPKLVGNQKRILISELSGRANIISKAQEFGITGQDTAAFNAKSKQVLSKVKLLESKGYTFEGAEASVELMIRRTAQDYTAPFELLDFNVITGNKLLKVVDEDIPFGESITQATVKLNLHGVACNTDDECPLYTVLEVAEGNGPVDALNMALQKALCGAFPVLKNVVLTDYKVRILDQENNTGAITRVMIDFQDKRSKDSRWSTVSAHPNIIVASLNALLDGFEYAMYHQLQRRSPEDSGVNGIDGVETVVAAATSASQST